MSQFEASIRGASYGKLTVLQHVDVSLPQGGMLVLLGSNGAGKTTTLRSIMGVIGAAQRRVAMGGNDLSDLPTWKLASKGILMVPDGARCFPNVSVYDNLRGAYAATHGKIDEAQCQRLLDEVIAFFPILGERLRQISGTMSGGQRQMLAVGRALMAEPQVLLLDEPSAGLAPIIVEELYETLAAIKRDRNCTIVLAEQNVGYATQFGGDCIVLSEGQVALTGSMESVMADQKLRTAYLGL
ncbi:ABC transporter ATP-binding protein [Parapusillimonas sp. JC17]|uniref:ABC transporter ATP-binding protein n=1 Tax=Parapusillimonas sp. JC17 TaxID=3445768 RepID=UPI003FA092FE